MKITERLAFIKAGYTKDEINKIIEEDSKTEETNTEDKKVPDNDFIKVISTLADEIKNIKDAIHKENISNTSINEEPTKNVDDILKSLINPYENKEE